MYVVWLYCSNRFPIGIQSQTVAQLIDCCHSFSLAVYTMCYECERKYPHKTLTHTHTHKQSHIFTHWPWLMPFVFWLAARTTATTRTTTTTAATRVGLVLLLNIYRILLRGLLRWFLVELSDCLSSRCPSVPLSSSCPVAHCGWLIETNNSCSPHQQLQQLQEQQKLLHLICAFCIAFVLLLQLFVSF